MIYQLRSLNVRIIVEAVSIAEAKKGMKKRLKGLIGEGDGIKLDELIVIEDEGGQTWICFTEDWLRELGIGFETDNL